MQAQPYHSAPSAENGTQRYASPSQSHSRSLSKQEPDSDDGQPFQSADDNDPDDELDEHGSTRNGKRKRPVSVSPKLAPSPPISHTDESGSHDSDGPISRPLKVRKKADLNATPRCELCKQRKVKCDRGQPSCGWCKRNAVACEYRERKKPGLRAGYGRELEQRLDRLEDVLRSHSEILQNAYPHHHTSPSAHAGIRNGGPSLPSEHGTPRDAVPGNVMRHHEAMRTPQAETALFLQKPCSFSTVSQNMDYALPPPTPSTHPAHDVFQSQLAVVSPPNQPHTTGQDYYGHGPNQTTASVDQELPPYDLLYALTDLYFKYINTWCPILHRKATLDSLFGSSTLDETDKILLHAIVATTLRYSTDARLTEKKRRHYHDVSKQKVLLYGMENSSVKSLQALVILALDLTGSGNGPPGWNIMALITRSVVQLGLAVESNSFAVSPSYTSIYTLRAMILPEPVDFIEEESRRRLFWMIYVLDRYATLATAFDFALDDREIDRTLPCRDDIWIRNQRVETRWFHAQHQPLDLPDHDTNKPENLGAFSYYMEIVGILSKIHTFLRQPVDISALGDVEQWQRKYKELDNLLSSWKFGLPGEYGNMAKLFQPGSSKALNCGWVMLHATYHTAVIRLHSSAAYPTTRSPIFTPSYSASQRCHQAVENVQALAEFVVQNGLLTKLGPPFAFTAWVAARVLLVHSSTVEHKLSPQISFFVNVLRDMGIHWPVAARYCDLLQRVLDEHSESERAMGATGERVTPSSVKILSDMRRTAFDLEFLISRQPRHLAGGPSRLPSVTPARTPAPNELEYLDVFDFFNVPRLPSAPAHPNGNDLSNKQSGDVNPVDNGVGPLPGPGTVGSNEFNITNYMVDMNSDWLFKPPG